MRMGRTIEMRTSRASGPIRAMSTDSMMIVLMRTATATGAVWA